MNCQLVRAGTHLGRLRKSSMMRASRPEAPRRHFHCRREQIFSHLGVHPVTPLGIFRKPLLGGWRIPRGQQSTCVPPMREVRERSKRLRLGAIRGLTAQPLCMPRRTHRVGGPARPAGACLPPAAPDSYLCRIVRPQEIDRLSCVKIALCLRRWRRCCCCSTWSSCAKEASLQVRHAAAAS